MRGKIVALGNTNMHDMQDEGLYINTTAVSGFDVMAANKQVFSSAQNELEHFSRVKMPRLGLSGIPVETGGQCHNIGRRRITCAQDDPGTQMLLGVSVNQSESRCQIRVCYLS